MTNNGVLVFTEAGAATNGSLHSFRAWVQEDLRVASNIDCTGRCQVLVMAAMKKKFVGRYIVTDPRICHGQPTFRGTRILVADVLEQVASGMAWENIMEEWRGSVPQEAIAEAVRLAGETFREHAHELGLEPEPAGA